MNETLPVIFAVVLVLLVVVLSVVGFQMVMVLAELRRTLKKVNDAIDTAELKIAQITSPLQNLGGLASGLKSGMQVFEAFAGWLQRKRDE